MVIEGVSVRFGTETNMAWYEEARFYHIYPLGLLGAPVTNDYGEPVSRLKELDYSIEEAAQDLGAGPIKTFMFITLPSIFPAIISGWLLAFTLSMDDLVITSFVSGPSSSTLPMVVFSSVRRGLNPEINALATIIVFIVSVCTFIYWLYRNKREKKRLTELKMVSR